MWWRDNTGRSPGYRWRPPSSPYSLVIMVWRWTLRLSPRKAIGPGDRVLTVEGPLRTLLTAERSLLNLLSQLSGVATLTASWVDAIGDQPCSVRDTRKTVPGLRVLQKYAVRCGGGVNHRMGLGD